MGRVRNDREFIVQKVMSTEVKSKQFHNQIIKHHSFNTNKQYGIPVS